MRVLNLHWSIFLLLMFVAFFGAIVVSDRYFRWEHKMQELKAKA